MADQAQEQLSAFVDDELEPAQNALLIRRLERDPEVRATWCRYHLIGEAIRRDLAGDLRVDLAERVMVALAEEAPMASPEPDPSHPRRWFGPATGFAVAASLVAVTLAGVKLVSTPEVMPLPIAGQPSLEQQPVAVTFAAPTPRPQRGGDVPGRASNPPARGLMLDPYHISGGLGSASAMPSMLTAARWVALEERR